MADLPDLPEEIKTEVEVEMRKLADALSDQQKVEVVVAHMIGELDQGPADRRQP